MTDSKDTQEPKNNEEAVVEPHKSTAVAVQPNSNRRLIITLIAVAGGVGLLLICAIGALFATTVGHRASSMRQNGAMSMSGMQREGTTMRNNRGNGNFGTATGDSSTRVSGVVTAVNGDSITVAGNGKTETITKTSSTTIRGTSSSIAVNDSVTMTGTTTNGTFTATAITIRNISSN